MSTTVKFDPTAPDAGRAILAAALDRTSAMRDLSRIKSMPSTTTASTSTPAEPAKMRTVFDGIEVSSSYVRPNGSEYKPRAMTVDGVVVHDVTFVRSAAKVNKPVLLYGPPGTGKTSLIEAAFPDVVTVQGTIETEMTDFVGSWVQDSDGTYRWIDGPLLVAADEGKKLLIDEIALIDPRSLAGVYGVMDGRDEIVVTQNPKRGVVKVQPGFMVLGAFNPNVPGAVTSDALMSRFPVQIEVGTDWSLASALKVPAKIIQVVRNLNHKAETGEITAAPQLRELLGFRDLTEVYGEEFALRNFISQIRPENRAVALAAIKAVMGAEPTALTI
jgi:MoxR-like ATPase